MVDVVVVVGGTEVVVVVGTVVVVVVVGGGATCTVRLLGYEVVSYANHILSPDWSPTTTLTASNRPKGTVYVTEPKLIVRDTQPLEPPLHRSRVFEADLMRLQLAPEGVQSSRYAWTTPFFVASKSFMALQKVSEAEPSRSTVDSDATQS